MKARFLFLAAVVLGLASCQTEPEGLDVNVGGEEQIVTVNVNVPETETRAAGSDSALGVFDNGILGTAEDNTTMRYILQVYYKDGENFVKSEERKVEYSDGKSVAFDVRLVPERDYQFVVWADVVVNGKTDTDNHYDTSDLTNVTLNNTWVAMDESRDAFTATEFIDNFNSSKVINITLKRPFAKLRVVTTDMKALNNLGIVPTKATVTYTEKHYGAFNAFAGKAIGDSKNRDIEHKNFAIVSYGENTAEGADMTLFTDYFFADDNDVTKFELEVFDQDDNTIKKGVFTTDIYVKRNNLTTIKGNILTDGKGFDVTIEDGFAGEIGKEDGKTFAKVDTAEELLDAINKGVENITLDGDIDLNDLLSAGTLSTRAAASDVLTVAAGKNITLDLNGKTISYTKECDSSYAMIENKGTLTINDSKGNGKISFKDTSVGDPTFGWGSYTLRNEGTLVVENGTIEHLGEQNSATEVKHMICAIFQYSGSTTINGGTISTPTYRSARLWKGNMTINGGNFNGQLWVQAVDDSSNLTINGGTFAPCGKDGSSIFITNGDYEVQFAVTGGFFNTKIGCTDATKAGVKGCIVGGTFTASAIENTNAALIAPGYKAVEENGVYVVRKPQELIDFENAIANGEDVTLSDDLTLIDPVVVPEGKEVTINLNGKTLDIYTHKSVGSVLKNNGTLAIEGGVISSMANNGGSAIANNGTLTVKNATLNGAPNADGSWPSYTVNNTGTMTLENSTITSKHGSVASYGEGAVLTLNNCTIDMAGIPGFTSHGIYTYDGGKVIINGGTYENKATDQNGTGASVINGNVEVNAGTFTGRIENYYGTPVLKGGTYSVKPSNAFVAEGYKVIEENGKYNVVLDAVDDVVSSTETLKEAIEAGNDTIALNAGEYVIPAAAKGKTVKFVGTGDPEDTKVAVTKVGTTGENCDYGLDGSTVTFENITITTNSSTYIGYARCNGTYKNCIINGTYTLYGDSVFEDCTFNVSGDVYNIWTWGAPTATFTNCTFNCDGKAMLLYGTANTKLTMNNCVFNDKGSISGKAAIETGNDYGKSYELTVNNATVNGFDINPNGFVTGTTLWANKNSMPADKLKVIIDGYTWVADGVAMNAEGEYLISKAAGLTWFSDQMNNKKNTFAGKTIKVVNDIDMAGVTYYGGSVASYPSYCFKGTFDGGEKVISNLTITVENDIHGAAALIPTLAGDGTTIKNVILRDVNISSSHYAAGIWGYTTSENCYINVTNCHVEGGTITGNIYNGDNADKVGGIGGIFYDGIVSGCSVKGVTITGYRDTAGIVGWAADSRAKIKNNTIENVTINVNNATNYKKYTKRSEYDVNNYVGEGVGKAKLEGNTGEATINWGSIAE